MASGISRVVRGSVKGTTSAINVKTVGFRPGGVKLWNVGGDTAAVWQDTMADASAILFVTAGDQSLIVADGITPLADGFIIGADADINGSGELIHWEATE